MDFGSVNWLAVIVSVIVSQVLGFIWYQWLFSNAWLKGMGKSRDEQPIPSRMVFVYTIIAYVVEVIILVFVLKTMGSNTLASGAAGGCLLWLGFVAPTSLVNKLFEGFGWKVWAIESGEHLTYLLVAGAILGAWH